MSRVVVSHIKGFEGTVTLKEPLMLADALVIREAVEGYRALRKAAESRGEKVPIEQRDAHYAPALCQCIESAQVANFPEHPAYETWRFSPLVRGAEFFELLLGALLDIYYGEQEETSPNA
jgi:hypothetical protein